MTSQVSTKVRLVKCPKCRQLLEELPDLILYQCGGCGTILQAKKRKTETNHSEQALQINDAVPNTQHEDGLREKETVSSNGGSSYQAGESSLDKKHVVYEHGESSKVNCSESEDSTVEVKIPLENAENKCSSGQISPEIAEGRANFGEFPSSSEEKESTTEYPQKQDDHGNEYIENYQKEGRESEIAKQGGNFLVEDRNSPEVKDERNDSPRDETTLNHLAYEDPGLSEEITQNEAESLSVEIVSHEKKDSSQTVELIIKAYDDTEHLSSVNNPITEIESGAEDLHTVNSPSTENESEVSIDNSTSSQIALKSPSTKELETGITLMSWNREELKTGSDDSTSHQIALKSPSTEEESRTCINKSTPPRIPLERSSMSDDPLTPDNENMARRHGSVSSVDTIGNSTPADHNLELSIKNCGTVNSPTTRYYYAYDDSESSYDRIDDRIQERASRPIGRTIKDVDPIGIREVPIRNRFRANNAVSSDHELNYRRPISSFILQERQHHSMKSRLWNKNKFAQTESDSGFTRLMPFHSREFTSDYRLGNPSVYRHNPLPPHPGFHSRDERPYSEPDKMDLLRTVCELKDQLDRITLPKVAPNMRYPTLNEESSHYYAQERDIYADSNLIPGRAEQSNHIYADSNMIRGRAERSNHYRPAFSGEAAHYRHHLNCSCLDCYPRDRYHSAQLPSHLSSPQHYSSSDISLWGREMKFDEEQRNRNDEIKRLCLREKYHTTKRHLRPLAGAAPVLTCYHCLEVLQLPEEFLLVDKRCHRLRCNACYKVLKLSLIKGAHLVPYVSEGPSPPPSVAEPVSLSNEYGRSFDRNCSAEEDASNVMQNRKLKNFDSKNKSLMVNAESVGSSSKGMKMRKTSSEIKEERASTLHRLMGYASPSQVFEQ